MKLSKNQFFCIRKFEMFEYFRWVLVVLFFTKIVSNDVQIDSKDFSQENTTKKALREIVGRINGFDRRETEITNEAETHTKSEMKGRERGSER